MAGMSERFLRAGYSEPKPLIEIDGKPIIEHIVNMFPGEDDFHFICNSEHVNNTRIQETLERVAPTGKIHVIEPHKKGPVFSVNQAPDCVADGEEAIVNYCDFGWFWDYSGFLKFARSRGADGAIPCYKGFHPHMLEEKNYAFVRAVKQRALEIREKRPFTQNRMGEFASSGTYYFRKGSYIREYFTELIEKNITVDNEYYVSMVYNLLIRDGLAVPVYEIQHMLQWGTPEDLESYREWSEYFRIKPERRGQGAALKGAALMPMAGKGSRFARGESGPAKPMIPVDGEPMFIRAARHAPRMERWTFVCLKDHLDKYPVRAEIEKFAPGAEVVALDGETEGQAITCSKAIEGWTGETPVMIVACDNGMLWDSEKFEDMAADTGTDAIVWTFRNYPPAKRNPEMYGWVRADGSGRAVEVSVKKPVSGDPSGGRAIVGAFYFRSQSVFNEGLRSLVEKNGRVNGEFYVDSLMRELVLMGYNVKVFEVDFYICWGAPEDLMTYTYWQSFFHKCEWHPYSLMRDESISAQEAEALDKKYRSFKQSVE